MATSGKGCIATNGTVTYRFESRTEAAKWLIAEGVVSFSSATVAKKIAAAIRDNVLYCGYRWSADNNHPSLTTGYNMRDLADEDDYDHY